MIKDSLMRKMNKEMKELKAKKPVKGITRFATGLLHS